MSAALDRARAVPSVRPETGASSIWEERPKNAPVRWHAVQSLIVSGKDAAELLTLVGELQGDGLLISSLNYELTPEAARSVEDELTQLALERLRQRAEKIAKSMGHSLARWRELRVGNTGGGPPPRPPIPMRAAMSAEAMQAPVAEPGESMVRVSVEGEALLEPADSRPP
jgi:predicted secreted protein